MIDEPADYDDCPYDDEFILDQEPRSQDDIDEAISRLIDQVWYTRCYNSMRSQGETLPPEAVAIRIETAFAERNELLEPASDFEWGMINGKLSALRWVCGDDWDFLDT